VWVAGVQIIAAAIRANSDDELAYNCETEFVDVASWRRIMASPLNYPHFVWFGKLVSKRAGEKGCATNTVAHTLNSQKPN
jgi:hypothetical protein